MNNLTTASAITELFTKHLLPAIEHEQKKYTAQLIYQGYCNGDDCCGQELEEFQADSLEEAQEKALRYTSVYSSLTLKENRASE